MIYTIDAAYAQEVLRVNYKYADVIVRKRKRLAARTMGIVRHDRFLTEHDTSQRDIEIRRKISSDYIRFGKITTNQ